MSHEIENAILRYLYYLKNEEGYDTNSAHEALLCKVNEMIIRTKDRKVKYNKSDRCERCEESDRTLYQVSSIKKDIFGKIDMVKEIVCNECCNK